MRLNNYSRENYEKTGFDHLGTKLGEIIFIRGIFVDNKLLDERGDLFEITHINNIELNDTIYIPVSTKFNQEITNEKIITIEDIKDNFVTSTTMVGYVCMRVEGVPKSALDYLNISVSDIKKRNIKYYNDLPNYNSYYTFEIIAINK